MEFEPIRLNLVFGVRYVLDSINPSGNKAPMSFQVLKDKINDVHSRERLRRFLCMWSKLLDFFLKLSWKNLNDGDDVGCLDNPPGGIICDGLDPCARRQPGVTPL